MQQTDPAPDLPTRLVVDISAPLARFEAAIAKYEELGIEIKAALADLIECLAMRSDAEYELSHSSYEMMPVDGYACMAGTEENEQPIAISQIDQDAINYVGAREEMGKALLKIFNDYKLYRGDRLFYQINQILGTALVLDKIGIPFLTEDRTRQRHVNNLQRQVARVNSFSHRRDHSQNVLPGPAKYIDGNATTFEAQLRAIAANLDRS